MEHLTLPALDEAETKVATREVLEVERLPDGGFRLLHSPAYVGGIAAGDVIDLDASLLTGLRVRTRSGNLAVVAVVKDDAQKGRARVQELIAEVRALGGIYDGGPKRALVFTIPVSVGFERIEAAFDDFQKDMEGAGWYYGNVLDREGRPLGWWNTRP
jgi:hypothetical protein